MALQTRPATAVCVVMLLLLAGCLSVGGADGGDQSPTTTVEPATTPTPVEAGCPNSLAFFGLGTPGDYGWSTQEVAIGYTLPPNSSTLLVVFENETVLGTTTVRNTNPEHAVTADGDTIILDEPLDGAREIRVTAFQDSDGNGKYDAETDAPCRGDDGDLVTTGPEVVDFDDFERLTTGQSS